MSLTKKVRFYLRKLRWRLTNGNNNTSIANLFPTEVVKVGKHTYGSLKVYSFDRNTHLSIGSFCSIAPEAVFMLSADHNTESISSFPYKVKVLGEKLEGISKGDIVVGDDVWIGYRCTILSGVRIGQGAVIAAGAVVAKDVPPYAVVGGVPARIIRYRFSEAVIRYLLTLDYSKLDDEMIRSHIGDLYVSIDHMGPDEIRKLYDWFPRRTS